MATPLQHELVSPEEEGALLRVWFVLEASCVILQPADESSICVCIPCPACPCPPQNHLESVVEHACTLSSCSNAFSEHSDWLEPEPASQFSLLMKLPPLAIHHSYDSSLLVQLRLVRREVVQLFWWASGLTL